MINIWFDILHTPQLNFYIPIIKRLDKEDYKLYITVLDRGKLPSIAKRELDSCKNVRLCIIGRHRMNKFSVIIEANLMRLVRLFFWLFGKKVDVAISNGYHTGIIGPLFGIKTYSFSDDPQATSYKMICMFGSVNHSLIYELPGGYHLNPKDSLLPVLKEWAYLNPRTFTACLGALAGYGLEAYSYIFVREVSVGTINYAGQAADSVLHIVDKFPAGVKVVLSLEKKDRRADYPADWILLQEPVGDIHSLIYYSCGLVSSGDSMAREAALLGVPAYYLGIRYDMPANLVASKVASLQNRLTMDVGEWLSGVAVGRGNVAGRQQAVRAAVDSKFIDINEYMYNLIKREDNNK